MSETKKEGLESLLKKILEKTGEVSVLVLSTFDGVELMTVYRDQAGYDSNKFDKQSIDCLVLSYTTSLLQACKAGLGSPLYSVSWAERGPLVHLKLDALVLTLVMEGDANLGLLEDHIAVLKKVLDPFSSTNFISVAL
ncbi:hypothetical protein B484DRAFT_418730 [Ochromonadaceae sp. CCMP2298]|nr:hypothetical protein B484DRAFT_418730 [Ochromonadaceae sp. CCMP2298]